MKLDAVWGLFSACVASGSQAEEEHPWQHFYPFHTETLVFVIPVVVVVVLSVLPECEFGFEHGLSLQPRALTYEQVVVVSLQRCFVNIKHFIPQVEGHAAAGAKKKMFNGTESTERISSMYLQCHDPDVQRGIKHTCHLTI